MRVLVVDDHQELRALVAQALERDGHVIRQAADVEQARSALLEEVDVIVLDVGLPDGSGLSLCRELRRDGFHTPILILTAHNRVDERVEGLDAGADDFLGKPFAIAELRARVRALGRRRERVSTVRVQLADVVLDFGKREAFRANHQVPITTREWSILETLASRRDRVVSRDELLESIWGDTTSGAVSSLEVLIGRIRRKLGEDVVRTLRGAGYSLGNG
ncbi:response regulator transcription factor [Vitiosangium sp. GDMCC 1.1324]|uniref:response regulator transcription factor n=1 Tax=Vitiosangium sp. (strain GDMCC 1.1324) TaxID=2138576 RepID=UPI000D356334|nr:response regulator transcription factor [Vitiosangium sp. GDMCC 1.1324]PTL77794.1 DNA-binding response regulator [Vitiosangium sp. GDMCC 1.1324]